MGSVIASLQPELLPQQPQCTGELQFVVHGRPAPQGSKRAVGRDKHGRSMMVEASKYLKPWRTLVAYAAAEAFGDRPLFTGAIELTLDFHFTRPKSHYRSGAATSHLLRAGAPLHHITTPDYDKLARAIGDALTGIVIQDDAQIWDAHVSKRYSEAGRGPGVRITVREL